MRYETILVEISDGIATVTINRPDAANAFSTITYHELADAVKQLDANPEARVIVITGAGKHFSAGGDIKRFKHLIDSGEYLSAEGIEDVCCMPATIRACSKPTIAMVNGAATGAGMSCAMACDFRVVEPKSKMTMAFINLGLCGDNGATYLLARLVGPEKAALIMMTGEPVGGERAAEIGLATMCVEEGSLEEKTYELAKKLASRPAAALAAQKTLLNKFNFDGLSETFKDEARLMHELSLSADFSEAVNAFLEKRPPVFTGK